VAERVRAESGGNAMLLVAVAGCGQPEDRGRNLAAGFDLHATRPIDMAQLLATIARRPGRWRLAMQRRSRGATVRRSS
jgi:CheY-like chemotaxis protein